MLCRPTACFCSFRCAVLWDRCYSPTPTCPVIYTQTSEKFITQWRSADIHTDVTCSRLSIYVPGTGVCSHQSRDGKIRLGLLLSYARKTTGRQYINSKNDLINTPADTKDFVTLNQAVRLLDWKKHISNRIPGVVCTLKYKKLSCRRDAARCFMSLNISQSRCEVTWGHLKWHPWLWQSLLIFHCNDVSIYRIASQGNKQPRSQRGGVSSSPH